MGRCCRQPHAWCCGSGARSMERYCRPSCSIEVSCCGESAPGHPGRREVAVLQAQPLARHQALSEGGLRHEGSIVTQAERLDACTMDGCLLLYRAQRVGACRLDDDRRGCWAGDCQQPAQVCGLGLRCFWADGFCYPALAAGQQLANMECLHTSALLKECWGRAHQQLRLQKRCGRAYTRGE